jgi:hypothetical protein
VSFGYSIIPLVDAVSEEGGIPTIEGLHLDIPETWRDSKPITPDELRTVLRSWSGATSHESVTGKDLTISLAGEPEPTRAYTQAYVDDYAADHTGKSMGHWLSLAYGEPEFLVTVAERIAQNIGPVLLVGDVGCAIIATPGTPADAEWASVLP